MSTAYRFHEFRLDCKNWTLYRGASRVDLQPKMIDTLTYLVAHAGEVVSNKELMRNVWPNVVVEINSLNRSISTIRTALGDDPPYRYIQTFKNQGYCFIAPIQVETDEGSGPQTFWYPSNVIKRVIAFCQQQKARVYFALSGAMVIICLFAWLFGSELNFATPVFTSRQLTFNSADLPIMSAAISPDGHKLAFIEANTVYITDTNNVERHALQLPDMLTPYQVDWFPDGLHLLISSSTPHSQSYSQRRVSVLNHEMSMIVDNGSLPSISPKGDQIAFTRNNGSEVWIADSNGQHQQLIESSQHNGEMSGIVEFSRDARYLLTLEVDLATNHSIIRARDRSTNQIKKILESEESIGCFLVLSNNVLLFTRFISPTSRSVQVLTSSIDFDTGHFTEPQVLATLPDEPIDELSATADGNTILMVRSRTQSDIYLSPLNRDGEMLQTAHRLTLSESNEHPAAWIDNNTILMASDRTGIFSIYRQGIGSNEVTVMASSPHDYIRPVISSDDHWLYYVVREGTGSTSHIELHRKSLLDGSEKIMYDSDDDTLTLHCASSSIQCVLAEHQHDQCIFYQFDPVLGRRSELVRLTWPVGLSTHNWDLSRDGNQIALVNIVNGENSIAIFNVAHLPATRTDIKLKVPSPPRTLTWDADTRGFYVSTYEDTNAQFNLMHVDLSGTATILRAEPFSQDGWAIPSPDGKHLAYQKHNNTSNIWLMQRKQPVAINR